MSAILVGLLSLAEVTVNTLRSEIKLNYYSLYEEDRYRSEEVCIYRNGKKCISTAQTLPGGVGSIVLKTCKLTSVSQVTIHSGLCTVWIS